jgi:hypothetical protein
VPATLAALGDARVFVTGLRTAGALRGYLAAHGLTSVTTVCSDADGDDDRACADFLAGAIDLDEARRRVRASRAARKVLDPDKDHFALGDLEMALAEAQQQLVMEVVAGPVPYLVAIS